MSVGQFPGGSQLRMGGGSRTRTDVAPSATARYAETYGGARARAHPNNASAQNDDTHLPSQTRARRHGARTGDARRLNRAATGQTLRTGHHLASHAEYESAGANIWPHRGQMSAALLQRLAGFRPRPREETGGGEDQGRGVDLWRKRLHLTAVWGGEVVRHEIQTFQRGNRKGQNLLNQVFYLQLPRLILE